MAEAQTPQEVSATQDLTDAVVMRVRGRLPGAHGVHIMPSKSPFASIGFSLEGCDHMFMLRRDAGLWYIREWTCDGRRESLKDQTLSSPRFEALIASLLGYDDKQPRVRIVDMRCPVDGRRLFGKMIIQEPLPTTDSNNLIEFSCPQCKRETKKVTMHLYSTAGEFVKTEAIEPWVRQESGKPWFDNGQNGGSEGGEN